MKGALKALGISAAVVMLMAVMAYLSGMFEPKIAGPGDGSNASSTEPTAQSQPSSTSITVRALSRPHEETVIGTVRPRSETVVSARISAAVSTVHVRAGDTVSTGAVLVSLDDRAIAARLAQHQQSVRAAESRLAEAAPAARRITTLFDRGSVSKADRDRADAALRLAQAEVARSKRAVDEARTTLSYATIAAPLAGRIIERYVEAGDTATLGAPLVRLYDPRRMRLEAHVRESLAITLRRGQPVRAHIDAGGVTLDAVVDEIVPAADAGSRAFLVKASLSAEAVPAKVGELYPGMSGRLIIPRPARTRLVVPTAAVQRAGQLELVYVHGERGLERRAIRLGATVDDELSEVLSGLAVGERIVAQP